MKTSEVIKIGSSLLKERKIQSFILDSELLLSKTLKKPREKILTNLDKNLNNKKILKFKEYLLTQDTIFISKEENLFKKTYEKVKKSASIKSEFDTLLARLKSEKVNELTVNKDVIKKAIEREILMYKFYKKGMYRHQLNHDDDIKKAKEILDDSKKYNKILQNK